MAKRHKSRPLNPWCSGAINNREKAFTQIGQLLLQSPAFCNLTPTAKILYICMTLVSYGHVEFNFTKSTAEKYGISRSSLLRGVEALNSAGFIEIVYSGKVTREPSRYRFSTRWKETKKPPG